MLEEIISGRGVWRRKNFEGLGVSRFNLDETCKSELKTAVQGLDNHSQELLQIRAEDFALSRCRLLMDEVQNTLNNDLGVAVIGGLVPSLYSEAESRLAYWLLGRLMGSPFRQNVKGDFLYSVRDMGYRVKEGVRASITAEETGFHTDYSFGDPHPDYVGLLCLQPAKEGGLSQIISAYAVHNKLLKNDCGALEVLYGPFYFDKRGEFAEGEPETAERPVFDYDGRTLTLRYMREYIRSGHEKMGKALTTRQTHALDLLDDILKIPLLQVEFPLTCGESLWINNRWIAHNRTAFKDNQQEEKKRHYVRLWLTRRPF
jgi:alpha-ketoglutarate-dependent taurine dioxygenase